jgi:hypothetical protein
MDGWIRVGHEESLFVIFRFSFLLMPEPRTNRTVCVPAEWQIPGPPPARSLVHIKVTHLSRGFSLIRSICSDQLHVGDRTDM